MSPALEAFLRSFRREREWTRRLVAAVPEERFDWRPAEGAFSCGELVRHLIQAERFWCRLLTEAVAGQAYDPFGLEGTGEERMRSFRPSNFESSRHAGRLGGTFAECLEAWRAVQEQSERAFATFTDEQLAGVLVDHPLNGLRAPLGEMLWHLVGHEVHHRGQLSAYLKVLGLPQPTLHA